MAFGKFGDMMGMMKQAKQMKDEMSRARYEGESGGIKAVVNGEMEILDVMIPFGTDPQKLGGLVKEAVNRALRVAKTESAKILQRITGQL